MRDRDTISRLVQPHAPYDWQKEIAPARVEELINKNTAVDMIVMAADIRSSTLLMKEAVDFNRFASILSDFVADVRDNLRKRRGWFVKFTGDGYLAYWIVDSGRLPDYFVEVVAGANAMITYFSETTEPELRLNSRNFPSRTGLSIGLDAGPTHLAEVAGDVTVIGPAVVGAVRMVSCAEPSETIANVYLGDRLIAHGSVLDDEHFKVNATTRATKEYPSGQRVYVLTFPDQLFVQA